MHTRSGTVGQDLMRDMPHREISRHLTICLFHDMFVHQSGLRRAQGTKNEILSQVCLSLCDLVGGVWF